MIKNIKIFLLAFIALLVYQCTKIDYAYIQNETNNKITFKINRQLLGEDNDFKLLSKKNTIFEYELAAQKQIIIGEIYNSKFSETNLEFDTLTIINSSKTLDFYGRTAIFNELEAVKCGDFMIKIKE